MLKRQTLLSLYTRLFTSYGPQYWWPAETPFEVMLGAVLTQNTSWKNVEIAMRNLRENHALNLPAFTRLDTDAVAKLVRPSGCYRVKARRLQNLCAWLQHMGGMAGLSRLDTPLIRDSLLSVSGIGPETADAILLYAIQRPVFVIDAYTRRLLKRLGLIGGDEDYESLRNAFETALDADTRLYNEYHALIVRHAKEKCSREKNIGAGCCKHCYVETEDVISSQPSAAGGS